MSDLSEFQPYLESIRATYEKWWQLYTLTNAAGKQRQVKQGSPPFDFGLVVQAVKKDELRNEEKHREEEKIERFPVLDGIRKYAEQHVLLVGRPGSGKSTALARLMLEEATNLRSRLPVLVELRYWQGSIEQLIRDSFTRHGLPAELIEEALKRSLILFDGVNELPSEEARSQLSAFRRNHPKLPMIFTTRDLSLGGDLGIEKKLEMQPLTEAQMQAFIQAYVSEQSEQMLRQLKDRLREFGQTPLLLWMLCGLFEQTGTIPENLGLVFREFTQGYERFLKEDVRIESDRAWWKPVLQQLAWVMMQGEKPTEFRVAIRWEEAVSAIAQFLEGKVPYTEDFARKSLRDLQKHHLIQVGQNNEELEFRHQLIQEYYAAETLLEQLPKLDDERLKREFLNFLKWTEPITLMLALIEHQPQAIRVVELALKVDWILGAKLAGEVKSEFQLKTVEVVQNAEIPLSIKSWILGHTRSEFALTLPLIELKHLDSRRRWLAVDSLRLIGSEKAIPELIETLKEDPEFSVKQHSVLTLGEIGSELAVLDLLELLKAQEYYYGLIFIALGQIGSESALQGLLDVVKNPYFYHRSNLLNAVTQTISEKTISTAIPKLLEALECHDVRVSGLAGQILSQIDLKELPQDLLKALEDPDIRIRWNAIKGFGGCNKDSIITTLLEAYRTQQNIYVRRSIITAMGQFGSESTIPGLIEALKDLNASVRWSAVEALGHVNSEVIIPLLTCTLEDQDIEVCRNAIAILGKIGAKTAVDALLELLRDDNSSKRQIAAEALGEICSEIAVPNLVQALNDPDSSVRNSAAWALGEICSEVAVPNLIQALNDSSNCRNAALALGKMSSEAVVPHLIKALKVQDPFAREGIIEALGQIGSELAVPELLKILGEISHRYSNRKVCVKILESLGQIGSELAVPNLLEILQYQKIWNNRDTRSCRLPPSLGEVYTTEKLMVIKAIESLGKIGTKNAVLGLVQFLELEMVEFESDPVDFISDDQPLPTVIKALSHIDSEVVIQGLMLACSHSHSNVRNLAAIALENGRGDLLAKYLPFLKQQLTLPNGDGWEELKAISNIQTKCRFYDYKIYQAYLEAQKADRQKSQDSDRSIIYNIEQVGIMNTGNVTIHRDQIGEQHSALSSTDDRT